MPLKEKKKKKIHTRNIMNKGKKKIRTRKIIKKKNRLSFKNQDIISYITRIVDEFISWNIQPNKQINAKCICKISNMHDTNAVFRDSHINIFFNI